MTLSIIAIVIAGLGLVVTLISLPWQVIAFRPSGSRAEVHLGRAMLEAGG